MSKNCYDCVAKPKRKPKPKPKRGGYESSSCSCSDCYSGSDSCSTECSDCEPVRRRTVKAPVKKRGGSCGDCVPSPKSSKPSTGKGTKNNTKATTSKRTANAGKKTRKC